MRSKRLNHKTFWGKEVEVRVSAHITNRCSVLQNQTDEQQEKKTKSKSKSKSKFQNTVVILSSIQQMSPYFAKVNLLWLSLMLYNFFSIPVDPLSNS